MEHLSIQEDQNRERERERVGEIVEFCCVVGLEARADLFVFKATEKERHLAEDARERERERKTRTLTEA